MPPIENILSSWIPLLAVFAAMFAPTIAVVVNGRIANKDAKEALHASNSTAQAAVVATEAVKEALIQTTAVTAGKLEDIHVLEQTIHLLVNSRLSTALSEIHRLQLLLEKLTGQTPTGEPPLSSVEVSEGLLSIKAQILDPSLAPSLPLSASTPLLPSSTPEATPNVGS